MIPRSVDEFDRLMEWLYSTPPQIPEEIKRTIVVDISRNAKVAEKAHKDLTANWPALEKTLGGLETPVLIAWGTGPT